MVIKTFLNFLGTEDDGYRNFLETEVNESNKGPRGGKGKGRSSLEVKGRSSSKVKGRYLIETEAKKTKSEKVIIA